MKKSLLYTMCLMALSMTVLFACSKNDDENGDDLTAKYVDLGLPSGTKWYKANEEKVSDPRFALYTYDEAVATFGDKLPSMEQWQELVDECSWTFGSEGYRVVGPNGKSIYLPAIGGRNCAGSIGGVGYFGFYWSSTSDGSSRAWYLFFDSDDVKMSFYSRCYGCSIRLVQN